MSARDLLRQVQALPDAERQQFLEGVESLCEFVPSSAKTMKAPDFTAYWSRMKSLGMPEFDVTQTQAFDRWLGGDE
jgi:hypothetical protein